MKTHKDLEVWKRSVDFVTLIYRITKKFPQEELFGLTNQLRRAAVSIPSNLAEGAARRSDKEFIQFLYIALGSIAETETQLAIANNLNFLDEFDPLSNQLDEIRRLTQGLIRYLSENQK